MDNGVLFQTIHGPEIKLIDTSHMLQLLQITLHLLDIYSFWHGIQENLERAPKTWNGFGQNKMEIARDKRGSRIYQSVNRRTMAIRMTANQPKVSSRKCRLRIDSFLVCPLRMTRLANTLILTAIIPSQENPLIIDRLWMES